MKESAEVDGEADALSSFPLARLRIFELYEEKVAAFSIFSTTTFQRLRQLDMMFASMRDQLGSSEEMALAALKLLIQNKKAPQSTSDDDWMEDNHDIQQLNAEVSAITKAVEIIQEAAKNWIARCRRHRNQVASLILRKSSPQSSFISSNPHPQKTSTGNFATFA
ncbi:hypothetical protein FRC03_001755 [Tulasnella sp. 419]|nr:hypothetical protein FRC03_001755 [Tulasnella sp. 419]